MAAAYPPGGTYFDGKKSFTQVPIENSKGNGIATGPFLDASDALVSLFDVLGAVAFKPVKGDIQGNIKKLRERQLEAPLDSETLQDLVRNELKAKKHTATEGLLWLVRGLDFTAQGLRRNLDAPTEELLHLVPRGLWYNTEASPLYVHQANLLCRNERNSIPKGLLRQAR